MTPTRRSDLVAAQRQTPPWGTQRFAADEPPVRVGSTGSADDLLLLGWTAAGLEAEVVAGAALFGTLGIQSGMRVANTLPGALVTPGALLVGDVNEAIGALDVPLGAVDTEAAAKPAWELFDRVQVNVLITEPGPGIATFFAACPAARRPWWAGIIWLSRGGVAAPVPPPPSFSGWQRTWLAVPEVSSFVAASCESGSFHVRDALPAAVVEGELVLGEPGYAPGVRARAVPGCPCGRRGFAFAF